jgi:D-alanyl-D-alanine dipeptidase
MIYHLVHADTGANTDTSAQKKWEIQLVDIAEYPGIKLDVRYARVDNFVQKQVYPFERAFLLKHVAEDLFAAHKIVGEQGFGILVYDGYRPWSVTKLFWDVSNAHDRQFLADPTKGSSHNRGCAVDLSLYHLDTGLPVVMPSDFDEMNEKAYPHYTGGDASARLRRDILRDAMLASGFTGIPNEWWHFNHISHRDWPVMNFSFEEVLQAPKTQHLLLSK